MPRSSDLLIDVVVEGPLDQAVLRALVTRAGGRIGRVFGLKGKADVERRVSGAFAAAQLSRWIVLLDLDHSADCAPVYIRSLVSHEPPHRLCLRVAVRAVEAWLLADAERLAGFLGVSKSLLPEVPDGLSDPKREIVTLARRSRDRSKREAMVPGPQSDRAQGPGYNNEMIAFVGASRNGWRPHVARRRSPSLDSCMKCIARLTRLREK